MRTIMWIPEDVFLIVVIDDGEMFAFLRDAAITECIQPNFKEQAANCADAETW